MNSTDERLLGGWHNPRGGDLPENSPTLATQDSLEWNSRARQRMLPPSFSDRRVELEFLREFRLAGLRSVAYACALGIAVYIAFGVVEAAYGAWTVTTTVRRLIAVSLLGCIVVLTIARPERVLAAYNLLLGTCSVVAIVGVVSVTRLLRDSETTALVNPVSLLALWVLYGFGRLPIGVAIFVGTIGSAFSMFGSRLTNMHEPGIRTVIYLIVANALGVLLARSIEFRERQLFLQRRVEEAAQVELQRRGELAEQASAEKTRLIAAVGHDLRQPMLAAVLHSEVLIQRLDLRDLEGVRQQANRVQESVKLLGATLEHVLTAARFDAGTEPVRIESVPLDGVFARLSELFVGQASAREISLRIRAPLPGTIVQTDEQALLRILVNLVSNAIKFTPSRGARQTGVVVRAFLRNGTCRITVSDTGVGIAERDLRSIWQPFFQVDNEARDRSKGLGLGLYLVRQSLARLSGHSVVVRSRQGRGTCFVVAIPGHQSSPVDPVACSQVPSMPLALERSRDCADLRGVYVLLLEDDQEARAAIEAQLEQWGVDYSSGIGVDHVLRCHGNTCRRVDGIIADYRLPGSMNGIESIQCLRQRLGYEVKAVLVTAESNLEQVSDSLPSSTEFIQKPFDSASLAGCLRQAIFSEQ